MNNFIPLEAVKIATPCPADWNRMRGGERARYCDTCEKHVYNLSGMSRPEAEALIRSREGDICIRLARRADGTVIADDCPVGLRAARDTVRRGPAIWRYALVALLLPAAMLMSVLVRELDPVGIVLSIVTAPLMGPSLGSMAG